MKAITLVDNPADVPTQRLRGVDEAVDHPIRERLEDKLAEIPNEQTRPLFGITCH